MSAMDGGSHRVVDGQTYDYQAFYCEENVWRLAQRPDFGGSPCWAIFITNAARKCLLWNQRAAAADAAVVWDYHVILAAKDDAGAFQVWDLDSRLPLPCELDAYLRGTFRPLPADVIVLEPQLRVVPAVELIRQFASDRRHMRSDAGWLEPPPRWSCPGAGGCHNLDTYLNVDDQTVGPWTSTAQLHTHLV